MDYEGEDDDYADTRGAHRRSLRNEYSSRRSQRNRISHKKHNSKQQAQTVRTLYTTSHNQTFFVDPLSIISLILGDEGGEVFCTGLNDKPPFAVTDSAGDFFTDSDCDVTVVVVFVPSVEICPPKPNGNRDLDFFLHP